MLLGRNFLGKTQHHPTWHSLLKRASLSAFFRLKAIRNEPCTEWHGWDVQSRDAEGPIWPLWVTDWRQTLHLGCAFTMPGLFACKQKRLFLKEVSSCFCFGPLGWLWSGRSGGSFSYTGSHALCWRHSFLSFPPLSSTSNPLVANFGFLVTSCWTMASVSWPWNFPAYMTCSLFLTSEVPLLSETLGAVHFLSPNSLFWLH